MEEFKTLLQKILDGNTNTDELLSLFKDSHTMECGVIVCNERLNKIQTLYPLIRELFANYSQMTDNDLDREFGAFTSIQEIYKQLQNG